MSNSYIIEYRALKIFLNILRIVTLILATVEFVNAVDQMVIGLNLAKVLNTLAIVILYIVIMGIIQVMYELCNKIKYRVHKGNIFIYKYNKRIGVIKLKNITRATITRNDNIQYLELYTDDRLRLRIPNDMSNYDKIKGLAKEMGWISTLKKNIDNK